MKESAMFTYGRFNPPHLGHKMMKLNKKVVVVLSPNKTRTRRVRSHK